MSRELTKALSKTVNEANNAKRSKRSTGLKIATRERVIVVKHITPFSL